MAWLNPKLVHYNKVERYYYDEKFICYWCKHFSKKGIKKTHNQQKRYGICKIKNVRVHSASDLAEKCENYKQNLKKRREAMRKYKC